MTKNMIYVILMTTVLLLNGCASLNLSQKDTEGEATLAPEFFEKTHRIAVQDFVFAQGVSSTKLSPADGAFLRSVIESKIVEVTGLEVITRKDQGILQKEMAYKFMPAEEAEDKVYAEKNIKVKLGVDAFIHGIIYEYNAAGNKYDITAAVKIVATDNGRIWHSKIIRVADAQSKHQLFDKFASLVAGNLVRTQGRTGAGQ